MDLNSTHRIDQADLDHLGHLDNLTHLDPRCVQCKSRYRNLW